MRIQLITLIAVLAAADVHASQIYKCTVAGKTSWQDKPCAGAPPMANIQTIRAPAASMAPPQLAPAGVAPVAPAMSMAPAAAAPAATAPVGPPARPDGEQLRAARIHNRVLLGMTEHDVLESAGKYRDHEVTAGADANGSYEIWVFRQRQEGFPLTIALRQGVVVEFSDRDLPYLAY